MINITKEEIKIISDYVYSITGIHLDESKAYLLEHRLITLLELNACKNYHELYIKAKADPSHSLQRKIIDAITTRETQFFRDNSPFDLLKFKILPDIIDRKTKRMGIKGILNISIWSAACSSGQEVYSIAIVLKELLGSFENFNLKLLGTDISDMALAQASRGIYSSLEIERGLPDEKLKRYFDFSSGFWKVKDEIRSIAAFKMLNLMNDFSNIGTFDIVLCRNVAIYFKEQDKVNLFNKISKVIDREGYLLVGSTESLNNNPVFEVKQYLRSLFYQKR